MNEKFDIIRLPSLKEKLRVIKNLLKPNNKNIKNRKTSFIIKCKF